MAVVASLDILLKANTRKFDSGIKKSQGILGGFSKAALGIGAAAAGAGLAIGALTREFEKVDDVAKLASRIGETTDEISRLQFAAKLTGAGADSLAKGLDVMTKRLGEAATGSGEAKKFIEAMGLSVDELIAMKPGEAFRTIAEGISTMESQAAKAAATSAIFSRANQGLVNTLDLGRKGLEEMGAESDKFGNTIKDSTVKQAEAALDAMTRLTAAFDSIKRSLAIGLAPAFTNIATELAEFTANIRELLGLLPDFNKLLDNIPFADSEAFEKLFTRGAIGNLNDAVDSLKDTFGVGGAGTATPLVTPSVVPGRLGTPAAPITGGRVTKFGANSSVDPAAEARRLAIQEKQLEELRKIARETKKGSARLAPAPL